MTDAIAIVTNILDANWTKAPKPSIQDIANLDKGDGKRVRLQDKDVIRIFETAHNEAQPELLYDFVNEHINLTLDIRTVKSRERLSELRNEVRRILHGFRKGDGINFDRIIFKTRTDLSDRTKKLFRYTMQCEIVTFSLTAETESTFINPTTNAVSGANIYQTLSARLTELSLLTPSDGQSIVGNGDNWVVASTGDISSVVAGTGLTGGGVTGDVTLNVSGLTISQLAANTLQLSSESFADNDTTLMTSAAIKNYVDTIVGGAPGALDTLNELAAAINDDASFASTITTSIGTKLAKASNLSDLANAGTARSNLGLGSMALLNSIDISSHTNLAVGAGLTLSGDTLSITDDSISEVKLDVTNTPTDNYILSYDQASGGFTWIAPASVGENNQNAFSTIAVSGQTSVAADSTTDTLTFVGGANVTITTTAGTDTITFTATDTNTEYSVGDGGLTQNNFTNALKTKLDGIEASADVTDSANVKSALGGAIAGDALQIGDGSTTTTFPGSIVVTGTTTTNHVETVSTSNGVVFEGSNADDNEVTLKAATVSADRTITLPDATGTVALTSQLTSDTNTQNVFTSSFVDSTNDILLRLTKSGASSGTQDIKFVAGTNVTLTHTDANNITISSTDTNTVYTHPDHSGEVTSSADGATVIASNVVDEDNLKVTNSPTDNYILSYDQASGGFTWIDAASAGGANQNAFSNVAVSGQTTVAADTSTDTLTLAAGPNVTITTTAGTDTVTIASTDTNTEYSVGDGGLTQNNFTNTLKSKLDGIAANATANTGDITAVVAGTGLSGGATSGSATVNLSHLGIESLSDPNADRILIWDDSAGAVAWASPNSNLAISGTNINATDTNTTYSVGDGGLTQNNFTNALKSKLDAIEATADVTDLANITTALATLTGDDTLVMGDSGDDTTVRVRGNLVVTGTTTTENVETVSTSNGIVFEGSAANNNELTLKAGTVSADRTVTIPDATFTIPTQDTTYSVGDGGLTQNNFTNTLKTKLDGIATSANNFSLPTAASDTLGGIKVGANLSIDGSGVLSAAATGVQGSIADTQVAFGDGTSITGHQGLTYTTSNNTEVLTVGGQYNGRVLVGQGANTHPSYSFRATGWTNTGLRAAIDDNTNQRKGLMIVVTGDDQVHFHDGFVRPATNNDYDLGSSTFKFKDAYFDGVVYADAINLGGTALGALATLNSVAAGQIDENAVDSSELKDGAIDESHLNATNSPTDNHLLSYDQASGGFTWIAAGAGGENNQNAFSNVAVSGQTTAAADSTTDTLTLVAAGGMTITTSGDSITLNSANTNTTYSAGIGIALSGTTFALTDPANLNALDESSDATDDKILLWDESASEWKHMTLDNLQDSIDTTATGGAGEAFKTISVSGQSNVVADAAADTLTFAAGSNVTITTDASSDTITFASTDTNTTYSVGDGGLTQNNFTNTLKSKLDGITASANNYALTDDLASGEITQLQNIGATTITATQWGYLGAASGAITNTDTTYSVGDGGLTQNNFTNALKTKLDAIEASATADQTASEITALLNDVASYSLGTNGSGTIAVNHDMTVAGNLTVTGTTITNNVETVSTSNGVQFEGSAANEFEILLKAGTVSADRTIVLPDASGTISLSDTNTNQLTTFTLTGDSGTNQTIAHGNTLDVAGGTGIATAVGNTDTVTVNLSHLGIESLSDPGADRLLIWDDSAGAIVFATPNSNLAISGTNVNATDTNTNTFRTITAGGNTLGASETLAFTAGSNVTITELDGAVTIAATDTNTDTNTQNVFTSSFVDSSNDTILRLTKSGASSGTQDIKFVAGSNVSLTPSGTNLTIAATDTNTEYSAGTGLALSGTTFSMADPADGTSIDEGTIAADDRMPIWDESASSWKYVTIDNLQDEIDTTASGGAGEAFKTIAVSGQSNVVADSATDTLTLAAGTNITLTTNASSDTVTIASAAGDVTLGSSIQLSGATSTNLRVTTGANSSNGASLSFAGSDNNAIATMEFSSAGYKFNKVNNGGSNLIFEGDTTNAYETTLDITDPTADRTIVLPDASGTISLTDTNTFRTITAGGNTLGSSETLAFTAGSNVTITESGGAVTIASTDTNTDTTYSAGNGIALSGTTFSVAAGTGLSQSSSGLALSHLGLQSLSDPNADRVLGWDDSAGTLAWFTLNSNITSSGTNINATDTNTNTTYSAGTGITLSSTTFSHTAHTGEVTGATSLTIADNVVDEANLKVSNSPSDNQVLSYNAATGGFTWINDANTDTNTEYTAGTLLDLSGTTFNVDLSEATETTVAVADDYFLFLDGGATGATKKEAIADLVAAMAGNNLSASNGVLSASDTNTNTTYSAGNGISLSSTTFSVAAGTGLSQASNGLALSHLGIESLSDPGADKILIWDDSAGAIVFATPNSNLAISGTNINATDTNTTYSEMGSGNSYAAGLVIAGSGTHNSTFLRKDGTWATPTNTNTNQLTTFTLTADSGTNQTIEHGNTFDIAGGAGLATVVGATDTVTINLDIDGMTDIGAALADADLMIVDDGAGGTNRKATMSRLKTYMQNGLTFTTNTNTEYTAGTLLDLSGTTFNVDLSEATEAAVAVASDYVLFLDGGATGATKKESIVDLIAATAGTNLTAANGVLSATNTTYSAGTNISLSGTTFNVDDAFLVNNGNDTTTGTITAGGFTTAGSITLGGHAFNDIDIGSEFVDTDDHIMSSGAIKEKIEAYSYITASSSDTLSNKTIAISQVTELSNLTAAEGEQLENIGTTTISAAQWGYLGAATGAITNTDTNTEYTAGTNISLSGTTFNVDDAFLKNNADDTTSGTITAGGFTTAGSITLGGHAVADIDVGSEFVDTDDHLMSSGAIKEKIEDYGYTTNTGDATLAGTQSFTGAKTFTSTLQGYKTVIKAVSSNTVLGDADSGKTIYWTGGTLELPPTAEVGQQFVIINNTNGAATPDLGTSNDIATNWTGHAAMADETARTYICPVAQKWIYIG